MLVIRIRATQAPCLPWLAGESIHVPVVMEEEMNVIKDCVDRHLLLPFAPATHYTHLFIIPIK